MSSLINIVGVEAKRSPVLFGNRDNDEIPEQLLSLFVQYPKTDEFTAHIGFLRQRTVAESHAIPLQDLSVQKTVSPQEFLRLLAFLQDILVMQRCALEDFSVHFILIHSKHLRSSNFRFADTPSQAKIKMATDTKGMCLEPSPIRPAADCPRKASAAFLWFICVRFF